MDELRTARTYLIERRVHVYFVRSCAVVDQLTAVLARTDVRVQHPTTSGGPSGLLNRSNVSLLLCLLID